MSRKPKPCPKCGKTNVAIYSGGLGEHGPWFVECEDEDCEGCGTPARRSVEEAQEEWNKLPREEAGDE